MNKHEQALVRVRSIRLYPYLEFFQLQGNHYTTPNYHLNTKTTKIYAWRRIKQEAFRLTEQMWVKKVETLVGTQHLQAIQAFYFKNNPSKHQNTLSNEHKG